MAALIPLPSAEGTQEKMSVHVCSPSDYLPRTNLPGLAALEQGSTGARPDLRAPRRPGDALLKPAGGGGVKSSLFFLVHHS